MLRQPTLETARLLLRPFRSADADRVQELAGDQAVADTMLKISHPYEDGTAEKWIANHRDWFEHRQQAVFAVTLKDSCATASSEAVPAQSRAAALLVDKQWHTLASTLIGALGLRFELEDQRAELGYWIGKPYWNQGYCTEAARAALQFGFEQLGLNRIFAHHFLRNPASGRVMQKLGMVYEGRLRQHVKKWDVFEDLEVYGIVKENWQRGLA
jgi:[ribosomal protein S5]-alanine N-acetyltransferase